MSISVPCVIAGGLGLAHIIKGATLSEPDSDISNFNPLRKRNSVTHRQKLVRKKNRKVPTLIQSRLKERHSALLQKKLLECEHQTKGPRVNTQAVVSFLVIAVILELLCRLKMEPLAWVFLFPTAAISFIVLVLSIKKACRPQH